MNEEYLQEAVRRRRAGESVLIPAEYVSRFTELMAEMTPEIRMTRLVGLEDLERICNADAELPIETQSPVLAGLRQALLHMPSVWSTTEQYDTLAAQRQATRLKSAHALLLSGEYMQQERLRQRLDDASHAPIRISIDDGEERP